MCWWEGQFFEGPESKLFFVGWLVDAYMHRCVGLLCVHEKERNRNEKNAKNELEWIFRPRWNCIGLNLLKKLN